MKALLPLAALWLTTAAPADVLRDPTRPPQPAARARAEESGPALTAVFSAGNRRSAIVNGRLVKAGDTVGGYSIEDVLADGVRYRLGGSVRELHLPKPADTVKKPAAGPAREASGGR